MGRRANSTASIMNIPEEIMAEILLLLPIKGIVMCKCTCKTWRYLISSAHFAKLHEARAKEAILIRDWHPREVSRMLYLIDPSEINSNYCRCNAAIESAHKINLKLDTKLKIPLHSEEMLVNRNRKRKLTVKADYLNPSYIIQNSCNGFLCLSKPNSRNPRVVCNPVTNEYIKLPIGNIENCWMYSGFGFGFCPETEEYKVIRIKMTKFEPSVETEIHTLGTNYWKRIGTPSFLLRGQSLGAPLYLNGVLYWYCGICLLVSFEFNSESFASLPPPPVVLKDTPCLGKFRDSLSLSVVHLAHSIEIFVFGIEKSWSKLITIPIHARDRSYVQAPLTSCSKCEEFFVFYCHKDRMKVFDPKTKEEKKNLRLHRYRTKMEALMYTPSFISLKDVVPGAQTQPISTGFLLPREIKPPYLREDEGFGERK